MRHRRKTVKLQRKAPHRKLMLGNLACSLIEHRRIKTTLAKAKALRPLAEKLVTFGKRNDLHARRRVIALLGSSQLAQESATALFEQIAPAHADRQGGYCRITRIGQRASDSAPMAFIEWVDIHRVSEDEEDEAELESAAAE